MKRNKNTLECDKMVYRVMKKQETKVKCPICESDELIIEGRCATCLNCGWSKCGV